MPELRWDLEGWYNKLIALIKTAKRFEPGTFATTHQAILAQVMGLIDHYAQTHQPLPQLISQQSLVEIYKLSPETLAKLTIYPSIIERLRSGNANEKPLAQRNWLLFKKLLEQKEEEGASAVISINIEQHVHAPAYFMKLERIALFLARLSQYASTGMIEPSISAALDEQELKRISLLREQGLINDEGLNQGITTVKQALYEAVRGREDKKASLILAEQQLYQHLRSVSIRLTRLLVDLYSDLYKQPFFSLRRLRGEPNPIITLLKDYKNAVHDVLQEIEQRYPEFLQASIVQNKNKQKLPL